MAELLQLGSEPAKPAAQTPQAGAANGVKQIFVTPKAVSKIREAFDREGVSGGLRLGVLGGGCSGLSYSFKFAAEPRAHDHVFQFDDVGVFVDPKSMVFLDGMTLDWKETLMQSGFVFENPHATKSCGCGSSFSA